VYHQTVVLKSLQDLPHVDHVLLVVSAADDNIVNPGKGGLTVSNSSVHVPLEGRSRIPQTKRHPLILEQAEWGGDCCLLHVLRIDWIWWYPFLRSILEKTVQPAASAAKSSMLGSGYTSGSVTRFSRRKSPHGRQLPSAFFTMCKGLDQGDVER
jgi:hypothetical protein